MKRRTTQRPGRSTTRLLLAVGVTLLAGAARIGSVAATAAPAADPDPLTLHRMVSACTVSMANNVCSVANGASASPVADRERAPVFVVGAGAIDRDAYGYLQAGGKAMCARAQAACRADWSGRVCVTARSLWAD